jgi:hypothetical protein
MAIINVTIKLAIIKFGFNLFTTFELKNLKIIFKAYFVVKHFIFIQIIISVVKLIIIVVK